MKIRKITIIVILTFLLIALFPIPIHTTTWPFNSVGHDFVSSGEAHPEECYHFEERWAGLLIGIQVNRIESRGSTDCREMYKEWGIDIRCRFHQLKHKDGYGIKVNEEDQFGVWSIPAGESATIIGFGIIPLKTWYMDSFSLNLLRIRIASSGIGVNPTGKYQYPNLLMFGGCDLLALE